MRSLSNIIFIFSLLSASVLWFYRRRAVAVVWLIATLVLSATVFITDVTKDVADIATASSRDDAAVVYEEPQKELENCRVKATFYQPKAAASGISRSVDREWAMYADSGHIEKIVHTITIEVDNSSVSNFMVQEEDESDADFKVRVKKAEDDYAANVLSGIKENGYLNKDVETFEIEGNAIRVTVIATEENFNQVKSISSLYLPETWPTYNTQFSVYAALDAVDVEETKLEQ